MKAIAHRRIVSALTAGIFAASAAPAWGKSPKEVFAKAAPSVVVVLALDSSGETSSQGSGVVVGKNAVATNCHVIEEAKSIAVRQAADTGGGESYRMDARVLTRDSERDLCLLFVEELSEPPAAPLATMGKAKELTVGDEVFAIGAPKGLELSLSRGVVSQLRGVHGKRAAPLVQTDAAISPGSSGGGLFNENGELVGITSFKWKGESLNFAIPVEWVGELREMGRTKLEAAEKRRECPTNPNYECVIAIAMSAAQSIDDAFSRNSALRSIASAQAETGNMDGAFATTRSMDDADIRAFALRDIASVQAEAGDMDDAFATTRSIDSANVRAWAWHDIALAQAKAGNMDGALATARSVDSASDRADALRGIASAQANAGDVDGAFATAQIIDEGDSRAWVLRDIAAAQAKSGDMGDAFDTARSIDEGVWRARALRDIAVAQTKSGDMDGAFATARNIDGADSRARALRGIASAQAKTGDINSALAIAQDINDAKARAGAFSDIALVELEAEDEQSARDTLTAALSAARSIDNADKYLLRDIASTQAKAGDMDGARATARSIDSANVRAWALRDIASARAEAGDEESARSILVDALSAARSIDNEYYRAGALQEIVSALAKLEDIDGAFATVRSMDNANYRAVALRDIALVQAEAEDFQGAMKTVMRIEKTNAIRIGTLAAIAKHLAARERNWQIFPLP